LQAIRNTSDRAHGPIYDEAMSGYDDRLRIALSHDGHRVTGPRQMVWDVITSTGSHLTVDEIARAVREADPTVNLSSVYRSLALFADLGLVRESRLGAAEGAHWELAHPDEQFHLKCTSCGRVEHHGGDLVARVESHLAESHGFVASGVELVVTGTCRSCTGSR
jgi:Fur family ferric uptake transcriptional regulator